MKTLILENILPMILLAALGLAASSCETQWLDIKRNKSDVMPASLGDLQAILDNNIIVNSNYPVLGLIGSDNIYIPDDRLGQASIKERNAYLFNADIYQGSSASEFSGPSQKIAYANIVFERLAAIKEAENMPAYSDIKGQALFLRGYALHALAQLFCKPYIAATASLDAGLQIRLSADPNQKVARSTVQQTYQRIIDDALQAFALLPRKPLYVTRGSKGAAAGLLARVYLEMADHARALQWADSALISQNQLLDYNTIDKAKSGIFGFPAYANKHENPEIIFYGEGATGAVTYGGYGVGFCDTLLMSSYRNTDLRRSLFFSKNASGLYEPTGSYTGSISPFNGIATNELYLIKAECLARLGEHLDGIGLLNELLVRRYQTGKYVPIAASQAQGALKIILEERRKELAFHGHTRWSDLRRLNQQAGFAKTITRYSQGKVFTISPGSERYVLPFPDLEVQLSGLMQNPR